MSLEFGVTIQTFSAGVETFSNECGMLRLRGFRAGGVKDEAVGEKGQEDQPDRSLSKRHRVGRRPALPSCPRRALRDSRVLGEIARGSLQLI